MPGPRGFAAKGADLTSASRSTGATVATPNRNTLRGPLNGRTSTIGARAALTLGALGVVYGDIGTSPLYAFRETFHDDHLPLTDQNILGACSLVFWALIIIVSLKYLSYVMRADNRGEGGILALTSLVAPRRAARSAAGWLVLIGLFGTALLYGDGVITPAISVLSAVEGIEVVQPGLSNLVVPAAVGILLGLFAVQRRGTGAVGRIFGPVMLVWFIVLAVLGARNVVAEPSVLAAINPMHGVTYLASNGYRAFLSLGGIFLVVTGGEALYADMGHFGRSPIRAGWFAVALPALLLNYFGQGALLRGDPTAIESPFFRMAPESARPLLVVLATCATVIASQALISGAYSLTVQAVQLDYLPRLSILHTSASHVGQVYVPLVNWLLMVGSIGLVIAFGSSANLAAAYGIAVTGTMGITTILMAVFVRRRWNWPLWLVIAVSAVLLVIDLAFFGANLAKVLQGGWFPLVVAALLMVLMTTWRTGRRLVAERIRRGETPIETFIDDVSGAGCLRVPGTAVYLFKGSGAAPPALLTNYRSNHVLHQQVVLLAVRTTDVPHVDEERRATVTPYGEGFFQVVLDYGFMEEPDVDAALQRLADPQLRLDSGADGGPIYFLGRETVIAGPLPGMASWRERLFSFQLRSAAGAARFFRLPTNRVVEVGSQVEL